MDKTTNLQNLVLPDGFRKIDDEDLLKITINKTNGCLPTECSGSEKEKQPKWSIKKV